ncbi:hypothetical protein BK133_11155 [Paenibacillus sp. FSL H8-0548]|uniref:hypothetical protein n=1 Tax=Paenibacillus sp. FSL H8-0548 TaxID=1920422 RepID=UPI00096C9F9C|nr:hypothetical protein [Paenibacillus sp. FSL H8-0548]OMF35258.1 hypothetical protein BK133_11155 [Paenibacillus sp. FSL H8-0548]
MPWIAPKLDWLPTDSINAADWNRIENNIIELVAYLNSIQYTTPTMTTVTNRTQTYVDVLSSINRIENNLDSVRVAFLTPPDYGPKETWVVGKGFSYLDAVRLEQNIKLLMDYGLLVFQSFRYCGATVCGDQGVII